MDYYNIKLKEPSIRARKGLMVNKLKSTCGLVSLQVPLTSDTSFTVVFLAHKERSWPEWELDSSHQHSQAF